MKQPQTPPAGSLAVLVALILLACFSLAMWHRLLEENRGQKLELAE